MATSHHLHRTRSDEESCDERRTVADSSSTQTASVQYLLTTVSVLLCSLVICTLFYHYDFISAYRYINLFAQATNSSAAAESNTFYDHPALFPLQRSDILGFTLAAFGLMLASGGGIGGGGILVPIYILEMGFMPKHAIPLSNVTVFGGAIANTVINSLRRHPVADRPLIDWDLILAMQPPTLFGALIGANLNKVLSETVVAVLLVILLSLMAYTTFKKALSMYRSETLEIHEHMNQSTQPLLHPPTSINDNIPLESEECRLTRQTSKKNGYNFVNNLRPIQLDASGSTSFYDSITNHDAQEIDSLKHACGNNFLLQNIMDQERQVNRGNVTLIIVMFLVIVTVNVLKGGGGYPSPIGISCGSSTFWTVQALLLVFIIMISFVAREILIKVTLRKMEAGYIFLKEDIQWDERSTLLYFLCSSVAGCCAGMFGIGGGIVNGPLMLAMGVHPTVASATTACMILFTSFTATTTYAVYGILVHDYAVVCTILGMMSTAVGQLIMSGLMKKTNRNSYIAFSIGVVILLSALLMSLQSLLHLMYDDVKKDFTEICGHI